MRRPRIWRKVLVWVSNIRTFLDNLLLGSSFQIHLSNRKVNKNIEKCEIEEFTGDSRLRHDEEILRREVNNSIEIIKEIEQKAVNLLRGSLPMVALLVAFAGIGGTNIGLDNEPTWFRIFASILFIIGILYLIFSSFFAIQAFRISKVWYISAEDYEPVASKRYRAMKQLQCIKQNHRVRTLKVNHLAGSFSLLFRGLILVLLFVIWNFFVGSFIN